MSRLWVKIADFVRNLGVQYGNSHEVFVIVRESGEKFRITSYINYAFDIINYISLLLSSKTN